MLFSIADFVANALIEVVERTGKRYVRMSVVDNYVKEVCHYADTHFLGGYNFVSVLHEDIESLADKLTIKEDNGDILVYLNKDCTTEYLRKRFRVRLSFQWLKAFVSERGIKALLPVV